MSSTELYQNSTLYKVRNLQLQMQLLVYSWSSHWCIRWGSTSPKGRVGRFSVFLMSVC